MKYIQIIKTTFLFLLFFSRSDSFHLFTLHYITISQNLISNLSHNFFVISDGLFIHSPPPHFQTDSEVTYYQSWGLSGSRVHLASHDIISSRHMTCHHHLPHTTITIMIITWPLTPSVWTCWNCFMSLRKVLCKYSANIVSCSRNNVWYLYGRWAPVECDLCEGWVLLILQFLFECEINFMNHKN